MDRQEAIIHLNIWSTMELVYKDYSRVLNKEMELEIFSKKWANQTIYTERAQHPELSNAFLKEHDIIQDNFDISISKSPRHAQLFWHRHDFYEIVYVLYGKCDIYFRHSSHNLHSGDLMMIAPHHDHQIGIFDDESIVLNILIRSSTILDIFLNSVRDKSLISQFLLNHAYSHNNNYQYLLFHTKNDHIIRDYILDCYIELNIRDEYSNRIATNLITILFAQLIRYHSKNAELPEPVSNGNDYFAKIMNFILEHFSDCNLQSIAEHMNFSPQYCSKVIKCSTGLSFTELITEIRIQKAKNLLVSTPMKISEISDYLGYSNPETLIRVFQKALGKTPAAYRKEHLPS